MAEKQSHKDTILIWHEAVQLFDRAERARALENLQSIQDPSAKILYSIGHIQLLNGRTQNAVQTFKQSLDKDQHMGIAHFQLAQTYYQQQNFNAALQSLEKARNCLRGNHFIDYKQLGLQYKLYECEILHNLAVAYAALRESNWALDLMNEAASCKAEARHNIIDSSLNALKRGAIPRPFSVPDEHIFRPPAAKVQNLKGVDYLGKAKVVSELVVPDSENKKGRSPSPLPPSHAPPLAPPPNRSLPVPSSSSDFKPISNPVRSASPNPKPPPSRPPPAAPSDKRTSPFLQRNLPPSPPKNLSPCPSPTPGTRASHKDTISLWHEGVQLFEKGQVGPALDQMLKIADPTAKILFSIGMLHLKAGNVSQADEVFQSVISKDSHLAIGHYQCGNIQCQLNRPDKAKRHYEICLECFRGNKFIDYKQLGLPYKLYEFEILHNQAWAYFRLGQRQTCLELLRDAQGTKPETKHDAIDNSLKNAQAGAPFDIMKLPKGALFRPPKAKIDNLNKIDFLGKAKVVSELNSDRSVSTGPTSASPTPRVSPDSTEAFYLPMSPSNLPMSPPLHSNKPKDNLPPRKSLPDHKSLPEPPRKLPPGPASRSGNFLPNHSQTNGKNAMPVPVRSTSLNLDDPPPSPGIPSRPVPLLPVPIESSTIPRRSPPLPPAPNGQTGGGPVPSNADRQRKVSPAFDPNKPLPSLPRDADDDEPSYANAVPTAKRRVSPVPPSKPLPPSPKGNSPAPGRRTPGPPDRPVPPSPNRLSPGLPSRTPPPLPGLPSQETKKRSVSPIPPKVPLPPPPPAKTVTQPDANGRSPNITSKRSQESNGNRGAPTFKINSQSGTRDSMVAVESYMSEDGEHLTFSKGEIIRQCREVGPGILEGEFGGRTGRFPRTAVQNLPYPTTT